MENPQPIFFIHKEAGSTTKWRETDHSVYDIVCSCGKLQEGGRNDHPLSNDRVTNWYIQNATASVMPIVDVIEARTYANSTTYYPMPYLSPQTFWYYKSAYNVDQYKLIDLIAEIQPHVDQGISTILYVTSETSTRELARLYIYAAQKGLKSLYYTRTKLLSVEECASCSV